MGLTVSIRDWLPPFAAASSGKKKKMCARYTAFTQDLDQLFNDPHALQQHAFISRNLKRHTDARVVVTFSLPSHHLKKVRSGSPSGPS